MRLLQDASCTAEPGPPKAPAVGTVPALRSGKGCRTASGTSFQPYSDLVSTSGLPGDDVSDCPSSVDDEGSLSRICCMMRSVSPAGARTGGAASARRSCRASSKAARADSDDSSSKAAACCCGAGHSERSSPCRSSKSRKSAKFIDVNVCSDRHGDAPSTGAGPAAIISRRRRSGMQSSPLSDAGRCFQPRNEDISHRDGAGVVFPGDKQAAGGQPAPAVTVLAATNFHASRRSAMLAMMRLKLAGVLGRPKARKQAMISDW